jgi:hypothetical protein
LAPMKEINTSVAEARQLNSRPYSHCTSCILMSLLRTWCSLKYGRTARRAMRPLTSHGKFVKISSTSALVNTGASEPALRTGNLVIGSVTILPGWRGFLRVLTRCAQP